MTDVRCIKKDKCRCEDCFNVSRKDVLELIGTVDEALYQDSTKYLQKVFWGYGCKTLKPEELKELISIRDSALRLTRENNFGQELRCDSSFYTLRSKALKYSDPVLPPQHIDTTNKESWALNNPGCVAYESWEEALYNRLLPTFKVKLSSKEPIVHFVYDLIVTKEPQYRTPIFEAVAKVIGDFKYGLKPEVEKALEDCSIEYDIRIEEDECVTVIFDKEVKVNSCELHFDKVSEEEFCNIIFEATGKKV